ncbi:hypothetical protein IC235_14965 [Hymenobacter sp. BT664]|uniref:Uncharacterized protein n=1 Tax=Hymenobacter montanus TaxID=2771359 RepID=A0A927BE65_9BACT|nr:hypothetical protein [Hymenobacter montanus]MBD2769191.1 hypothetical protein [Hymenobacter montanus]
MDNQQNQSGTPMPGDDVRVQNAGTSTGSTGLGNDATVSGGARKSSSARSGAQGASETQASGSNQSNQQNDNQGDGQTGDNILNTALASSKKWIEDSGVLSSVNQFPQNVKEWSNRAVSRVNDLSTTQKVVGGALLAVGIGLLATRKGKSSKSEARYGRQSGSYGRSGYQSTDALGSRRSSYGSSRSESGSAYGSSNYGSSSGSYGANSGSNVSGGMSSNASTGGDFSPRTSESSYRSKSEGFRDIE